MSVFGAIVIYFIGGLLALIIRIFFFVDINEVEKSKLNRIKISSFSFIVVGILFLSAGLILLFIFYPKYSNPLEMLYSDFLKLKSYLGLFFVLISTGFFVFNEKIVKNWKEDGIVFPISEDKNRTFTISIGLIFLVVGLIFIII